MKKEPFYPKQPFLCILFHQKSKSIFSWNSSNPKYFQWVKPPPITILKLQNIQKYPKKSDFLSKFWKYFDFFWIFWYLPLVKFCTVSIATFWNLYFDPKMGLFLVDIKENTNYVVLKGTVYNFKKSTKKSGFLIRINNVL